MNGRSLSSIKHTALYKTTVSRFSHLSAKSVYFSYKVSLCSSAY